MRRRLKQNKNYLGDDLIILWNQELIEGQLEPSPTEMPQDRRSAWGSMFM